MKRYGDISTTMVSLLKSLHRFGKTSRAAGRVIPQPQPTRPSRRQRNIRLPLEVNKKTPGNSQPFQEDVLQQRYPQLSYFSAALKPLKPED